VHYGSGPKRFPIQDVLQCALEFAEHGPVGSQQPVTDMPPADGNVTAAVGENTNTNAMCLGSNCAQTSGIMDVDMESPHSLSRLDNTELLSLILFCILPMLTLPGELRDPACDVDSFKQFFRTILFSSY